MGRRTVREALLLEDVEHTADLGYRAIESLMKELTGKEATDWGLVNEASIALNKLRQPHHVTPEGAR